MKKIILVVASLFFISISNAAGEEEQKQFWEKELKTIFAHIQKKEYQEILARIEKEVWLGVTCSNVLEKYPAQDKKTVSLIQEALGRLVNEEIGEFEVVEDKDEPQGVTLVFNSNCHWGFFFKKEKQDKKERILIVGIFTPMQNN